jgi:hypothetical protein
VVFGGNAALAKDVLGPGGLPPLPSGMGSAPDGKRRYDLEQEQSYGNK